MTNVRIYLSAITPWWFPSHIPHALIDPATTLFADISDRIDRPCSRDRPVLGLARLDAYHSGLDRSA
jgi:hypothetical protein